MAPIRVIPTSRLHEVVAGLLALALSTACATQTNPLQERAYNAFKDCQWSAPAPTAQITEMREDGIFNYTAREGDVVRMKQCLEQRYGYKFQ
jgi:hypothetical protein